MSERLSKSQSSRSKFWCPHNFSNLLKKPYVWRKKEIFLSRNSWPRQLSPLAGKWKKLKKRMRRHPTQLYVGFQWLTKNIILGQHLKLYPQWSWKKEGIWSLLLAWLRRPTSWFTLCTIKLKCCSKMVLSMLLMSTTTCPIRSGWSTMLLLRKKTSPSEPTIAIVTGSMLRMLSSQLRGLIDG